MDGVNLAPTDPISEGIQIEVDAIALTLSDDDVARAIGNRVTTGKSYWNKEYDLENVQKRAEDVWLGLCSADVDYFDFQERYSENRIMIDIETLVTQAVGRPPQPVVTEAYDTDASRELAENVGKVLLALYRDQYMHSKFQMVARHLLSGFRYGVMKYRWDTTIGRKKKDGKRSGGIVVDVVRPDKIVFDAGSTDKDNIALIAEYMEDSWETLVHKFPAKSNDIMAKAGVSKGTHVDMTKTIQYPEVWFTGYHPETGEEYEAVAWKIDEVLMGKMRNPNYNYDEFKEDKDGKLLYNNFFDKPRKPYAIFNYLNQGKHVIDSTSLVDQARQLQRQLEKRGHQIDYNADMANAGTVVNSEMVDESKVAKLIGDPGEKLMVKGDVTKAAMRLPSNQLEDYVIQDKSDLRAAIDNIMGANAPIQGQQSGNKTLGQDELSVQRNNSRLDSLVKALEDGADRIYKAEVQMMKVFFTEPDMVRYIGPAGKTEFINFSSENIESGIGLTIKDGSLLPDDPAAKAQQAQQYVAVLDPLTLAEEAGFEDPKNIATRMFTLKSNPGEYGEKYLGIKQDGNHDPDAVNAIQQISQGQTPQVPQSPSKAYVGQLQAHIGSPAFKQMNPISQAQLLDHAKQVASNAKNALGINPSTVPPTPEAPVAPQPPKKQGFLGKVGSAVKQTLFK